jgi:hypothetical protein
MTSLFSQGAVTGSAGGGGSSAATFGTEFEVSEAGTANGMWWYAPPADTSGILPTGMGLFDVTTEDLIASNVPAFSGHAGGGWIYSAFTSPPLLDPGVRYKMAFAYGAGGSNWYLNAPTFASAGVTNGPLTAFSEAASTNGQLSYGGASLAYPTGDGGGANIWMDIDFTAALPPAQPSSNLLLLTGGL